MTESVGSEEGGAETQRIVIERPLIDVTAAKGGWADPWPNVAELESLLPHNQWTLIGGLMTQMHAIHRGVDAVRPTNDVDIVLRTRPDVVFLWPCGITYTKLLSRTTHNRTATTGPESRMVPSWHRETNEPA